MHSLLLETILTAAGLGHTQPPSLASLSHQIGRSPLHHLKSYSLSDNGRWLCIIPGLLLCWLEEAYIRPQFLQAFRNDGKDPLSAIVQAFGTAAKSNAITMMNELSLEDRANVSAIVKGARKQYQQLLSYGTYAWETNSAASRLASRTASKAVSRAGSPDIFQGIMGQVPIRTKKGLKYGSDQGRPNVHTALHFEPMMEEYGSPAQSHVLIREDKHRGFKKAVYRTNHNNVTYELLRQESLQQTIRLILLNGFKDSDPVITQILGDFVIDVQRYLRCPLHALSKRAFGNQKMKTTWQSRLMQIT